MYIIGIDGGGTKTTALLSDTSGKVLGTVTGGASNPTTVAEKQIQSLIAGLIKDTAGLSGIAARQVKSVYIGMSGYSYLADESALIQKIHDVIGENKPVTVTHDAITALYSGTGGKPGIVNISGTGSITFGINSKGDIKRAGGWGYLIDHTGSGYGMGLEALKLLFHLKDAGVKTDEFSKSVLECMEADSAEDLIPVIYDKPRFRERISALSPVIMKLADKGNESCRAIIDKASGDMADSIRLVRKQLFNEKSEEEKAAVPVVLTGGLMKRSDLFLPTLRVKLPEAQFIIPPAEPVVGAVIAAGKAIEVADEQRVYENLIHT